MSTSEAAPTTERRPRASSRPVGANRIRPTRRRGTSPPEGGHDMGPVIANASMSLDGYIAKDDNTIGRLFDWLQNGDVELPTASPGITFHVGAAERRVLEAMGRRSGRAGLRPDAVRLHGRLGRAAHDGRASRRRHPRSAPGLDRGAPRRAIPLRDQRRPGRGGEGTGARRRPDRRGHRRHDRRAVPGARAPRRRRRRPGARGDGQGPPRSSASSPSTTSRWATPRSASRGTA